MIARIVVFFLPLLFFSCRKDEKVILKEEKAVIKGVWFSSNIRFRDYLNDKLNVDNSYQDTRSNDPITPIEELPSQIRFNPDGTYTSVSHKNYLNFAIAGNLEVERLSNGTWFLYNNNELHFDKGYYEFNSLSPKKFKIIKIDSDSLVLETSEVETIYEWAYVYGTNFSATNDLTHLLNQCSDTDENNLSGKDLAEKYATYKGYLDAVKNAPKQFNPFGLGLRQGSVDYFLKVYSSIVDVAPLAEECYRTNYDTFYKQGFDLGKSQYAAYNTRHDVLTFYFSRNINP